MTARTAANIFVALSTVVAAFQIALVLGAPWGEFTLGGRYPGVLPPAMRAVAAFSFVLVVSFAWVVAARSGRFGPAAQRRTRVAIWFVVAYGVAGVVANAVTPSEWERIVWLPVVSILLVTSLWVARRARFVRDREVTRRSAEGRNLGEL